jgi:magnesium transporter
LQFITLASNTIQVADQAPATLPATGFLWCDCPYDEARHWVDSVQTLTGINFFEDHLFDAENPNHPSYFDSTHRYEMIVFRGLDMKLPSNRPATGSANGSANGSPAGSAASEASVQRRNINDEVLPLQAIRVKTVPSVFFLMPGCLVTVRPTNSAVLNSLKERVLAGVANKQRLPSSPEELMLRMLNVMVDRYLDLRQPLSDQLEYWQHQLLNPRKPFRDWMLLLEARSEARKLEQLCEEQLDAIQEWRDERLEHDAAQARQEAHGLAGNDPSEVNALPGISSLPALSDSLQVRASDVVEHIQRVLSHARRLEDSVESAVQLHFSATTHRTNEIIRTLTTITAVFMPLTLITGIFGMNFESIPGLHSPFGFWLTMAGMLIIVLVMLVMFRRKHFLMRSSTGRSRVAGG